MDATANTKLSRRSWFLLQRTGFFDNEQVLLIDEGEREKEAIQALTLSPNSSRGREKIHRKIP